MQHRIKAPPPSAGGAGGGEDLSKANRTAPLVSPAEAHVNSDDDTPFFSSARELADLLEVIADWKLDLERRLARAELLLYLGLSHDGFADLASEIHEFNSVCLAVASAIGGSRHG